MRYDNQILHGDQTSSLYYARACKRSRSVPDPLLLPNMRHIPNFVTVAPTTWAPVGVPRILGNAAAQHSWYGVVAYTKFRRFRSNCLAVSDSDIVARASVLWRIIN